MMCFSEEIASLKAPERKPYQKILSYKFGFSEARHEAFMIALNHNAVMSQMVGALEAFVNNSSIQANYPAECEQAEAALALAYGETK